MNDAIVTPHLNPGETKFFDGEVLHCGNEDIPIIILPHDSVVLAIESSSEVKCRVLYNAVSFLTPIPHGRYVRIIFGQADLNS